MEIAHDTVEINVLIYPQDNIWVAQGIQHDIAARGENPVEASEQFNDEVRAELIVSLDRGDARPLSGIGRAPGIFEEMYRRAKFRIVDREVLLDIVEANPPRLRPHIKITDEKQSFEMPFLVVPTITVRDLIKRAEEQGCVLRRTRAAMMMPGGVRPIEYLYNAQTGGRYALELADDDTLLRHEIALIARRLGIQLP